MRFMWTDDKAMHGITCISHALYYHIINYVSPEAHHLE